MKKEINGLCRICTRNCNDEYCEMGNDSYGNNSLRYMNDCEDFVLKEQDDENEDSLNNNNSLKKIIKIMKLRCFSWLSKGINWIPILRGVGAAKWGRCQNSFQ